MIQRSRQLCPRLGSGLAESRNLEISLLPKAFNRCLYFGNVLNENPRGRSSPLPSSTHLLSGLQSLLGHEGKLPRDFLVQLLQLLFPSHCEKSENYLSFCVVIIIVAVGRDSSQWDDFFAP